MTHQALPNFALTFPARSRGRHEGRRRLSLEAAFSASFGYQLTPTPFAFAAAATNFIV
jgi:hypothetical protein